MTETTAWQSALTGLFKRYLEISTTQRLQMEMRVGSDLTQRTTALCQYAATHLSTSDIGEDKANRWLGFVQGVLIAGGVLTIEGERDFTRPIFHALKGSSPSHDARGA